MTRAPIPERARSFAAALKRIGVDRTRAFDLITAQLFRDGAHPRVAENHARRAVSTIYLNQEAPAS
jgi:hypothetical protein